MSLLYALLGIPQTLDEAIDVLKTQGKEQATIRVVETQYADRIVHQAAVDLGNSSFFGAKAYTFEKQAVFFTQGSSGFSKLSESECRKALVLTEAQHAKEYLAEQGISANITNETNHLY